MSTTIEVWWRWDWYESRYVLAWVEGSGPRPFACDFSVTKNQWVWAGFWNFVTKRYQSGDFICTPIVGDVNPWEAE